MPEAKKPAKPIVDVVQPGKSAPAGTSKPVLVTNRPILKDPMVVPEEEPAVQPPADDLRKPSVKPKIEPLVPETAPAAAQVDQSATEPPSTETAPEEKPEEQPADTTAPDKPDAVATSAQIEAEAEKQVAQEAETQKLVDSKQYFLPINSVENRRTKRFIMIGILLSLVLAAAWVDIALDAGLIHLGGLKSLTHFFSN